MNTSISPLLQRVKPLLGSLAGKAKTLLGKVMAQILTLLVKTAKHPQIKETGETCSDLWSDLKKLKHHPKVLTWREHMAQRIGDFRDQPESQTIARIRESIHPPYLALSAGTFVAVAMGMLGTKALKHSQNLRTHEITREASMQIRQIRLQQKSQSLDSWRSEQEKLQRALKALERSRSSGASKLPSLSLYS